MVTVAIEVSNWCSGISVVYGLPALLSMLFSIVLMMIDFIKPCVTSNKVMDKSMTSYVVLCCSNCTWIAILAFGQLDICHSYSSSIAIVPAYYMLDVCRNHNKQTIYINKTVIEQ